MKNINIEELFFKYNEALKILEDKFYKLYQDNLELGERNPIDHIKYRIKSEKSIKNKLENKQTTLDYTAENIEHYLHDIAGIRIICPFLSDVEKVISYVEDDPSILVLDTKNYIQNPKENGYMSYHMKVSVPVIINGITEYVKAEIQIRTMAMDLWAHIEHIICYKKETDNSRIKEMKRIAQILQQIDPEMDALAKVDSNKKSNYKVKTKKKITND